jgi:hypothetical protein
VRVVSPKYYRRLKKPDTAEHQNIKNSEKRELESPLPLELLSIQPFSTVRKQADRNPAEKQT